jgi:hypothetical protein
VLKIIFYLMMTELFVMEAKMLVNKRPIEYKNILCKDTMNEDSVSP